MPGYEQRTVREKKPKCRHKYKHYRPFNPPFAVNVSILSNTTPASSWTWWGTLDAASECTKLPPAAPQQQQWALKPVPLMLMKPENVSQFPLLYLWLQKSNTCPGIGNYIRFTAAVIPTIAKKKIYIKITTILQNANSYMFLVLLTHHQAAHKLFCTNVCCLMVSQCDPAEICTSWCFVTSVQF